MLINKRNWKRLILNLIFISNVFAIFGFWWLESGSLFLSDSNNTFIALGRLTGLLGQLFILLELILIGRIPWIEQLYGFDKLNKLHRWTGYSIIIFFITHPLFLSIGYAGKNSSVNSHITAIQQFIQFMTTWRDIFPAFIAIIIFIAVIISSIAIVRKKFRYEAWHFIHLATYIAIGMAFSHQTNSGDMAYGNALYYWCTLNYLVFGLVLLYRFLRPFFLFYKHRFYIKSIKEETGNVLSIYISGKNIGQFKYKPGQYANFIFLKGGMFQTHPFSFSCAPNEEYIRISIKNVGDYTSKISLLNIGCKVIIDGPLGTFTEENAVTKTEENKGKFLFIAGGIGITPIRALLEGLKGADTTLLYGARSKGDLAFDQELQSLTKNYFTEYDRITIDKIQATAPDFKDRDIYICGPVPMMDAIIKALKSIGVDKEKIHFERFGY